MGWDGTVGEGGLGWERATVGWALGVQGRGGHGEGFGRDENMGGLDEGSVGVARVGEWVQRGHGLQAHGQHVGLAKAIVPVSNDLGSTFVPDREGARRGGGDRGGGVCVVCRLVSAGWLVGHDCCLVVAVGWPQVGWEDWHAVPSKVGERTGTSARKRLPQNLTSLLNVCTCGRGPVNNQCLDTTHHPTPRQPAKLA